MLCNLPYSYGPDPAIHENQRLQQRRFRQRYDIISVEPLRGRTMRRRLVYAFGHAFEPESSAQLLMKW
jgi:hypothetical protein